MEQKQSKSQYILWIVAVLLVFGVVTLLGSKIFYGHVVPQVQTINQLGIFIILSFAFIAGVAAFFAPCPFAVFPAYIAYFLNTPSENDQRVNKNLLYSLKIGAIVSLGIFSFYGALGVIMAVFGTTVAAYTYYLKLAIIPLFFILGFILLTGKSVGTRQLDRLANVVATRARGGRHFTNMYLYGIVYGIAAAACHLPILLALALYPILAGHFLTGLLAFIIYAFGASSLLIFFTILIGTKRNFLTRNLGLYGERVKKVGGGILILTGIYLISFYILFGM
jgi:cytochrome c biogenesis protein CcdA